MIPPTDRAMLRLCGILLQSRGHTWRMSLRWHLNAECSKAFMTDIYESFKSVYFPTNAMETESKRRSWLQKEGHEFQKVLVTDRHPLDRNCLPTTF
jgi:hypothetical protein